MVILAESFWQNVYKVLTTPSLQLFLLLGSLILAISLLLLTMTRLGHARPITKCVVLSVIAHILLLGYAYGTKLISHVPLAKKEEPVQINLVDDIDEEEPELPLPTSEDLVDKFDHSILPDEHVSLQRPEPTVPFEMERIVELPSDISEADEVKLRIRFRMYSLKTAISKGLVNVKATQPATSQNQRIPPMTFNVLPNSKT
jgi:hypothetical protein